MQVPVFVLTGGEDFRYLSIIDRKLRLRRVVPAKGERLLYCDHIERDGQAMFRVACEHDLEGIVAKRKSDPYLSEHTTWLKIRNTNYSQWANREDLFERERSSESLIFRFGMAVRWRAKSQSEQPG
jgi:ATP-dependent DNA ligase